MSNTHMRPAIHGLCGLAWCAAAVAVAVAAAGLEGWAFGIDGLPRALVNDAVFVAALLAALVAARRRTRQGSP